MKTRSELGFLGALLIRFPSFFINIVSGSSRDKPNNNVGGLVFDLPGQ